MYPGPAFFTVAPQFVKEFSLGTCLWAWINDNPVNGAVLEFCNGGLTPLADVVDNNCVTNPSVIGSGGYALPIPFTTNPFPAYADWIFDNPNIELSTLKFVMFHWYWGIALFLASLRFFGENHI
ncbi:hypothetical protein B0H11DRAFT_1898897 [Mycena galericulata]|nr:hypothetical protein B0H11DRAFT_1898897 [Mycena galericulata]